MSTCEPISNPDFFISYAREDLQWAEWIAWELEANGYNAILEAWDFRPGHNFLREIEVAIEHADRTLIVLTPDYLASAHAKDELFASMLYGDEGHQRLLPVRVLPCDLTRFLGAHIYIDLVGLAQPDARTALLRGVARGRDKPERPPSYPGASDKPLFPGGRLSLSPHPVSAEKSPEKKTLAILPFTCDGLKDSYLLQGFCDDLVGQLTRLQIVLVISPSSVEPLLPTTSEPSALGRRVGADLVLVGNLRPHGPVYRLQLQLIQASTSITTWAKIYPFDSDRLLRLKSKTAKDLVATLNANGPSRSEIQLERSPTHMDRAYELYLRGYGLLSTNEETNIQAAVELLDSALGLDPRFARAQAARGYAEWRKYFSGWDADATTLDRALQDAEMALRLEPHCIGAHMTMIRICWDMGWHERALQIGRSVYQSHPGSLEATLAYARAFNNAGMAEEALPLTRSVLAVDRTNPTALKLVIWNHLMVGDADAALKTAKFYLPGHPLDSNTRWAVSLAYYCVGEVNEAVETAKEALRADPTDVTIWSLLGYLYRLAGDEEQARESWIDGIRQVTRRSSAMGNWRVQAWLANLEAASGNSLSAISRISRLTQSQPQNGYLRYRLSHVLAELGRTDEAVQMLNQAVAEGFLSIQILRHEEKFALSSLVGIPEYWEVMKRLSSRVATARRTFAAEST